tara:strand:+ start:47 stop:304 length:258 start_codon:yes stop_codon:yes gene_type:complete
MPEKVTEKLKRLGRELADSVRAEIDLREALIKSIEENKNLKKFIACYVSEKENIFQTDEAVSFVKGFYEAKKSDVERQTSLPFDN